MTPEEIAAQQEASLRMQALHLADKRKPADASMEDVLKDAEKVLKFIKAGVRVAG
ncbi:hypothetical protein Pam5_68 [Pseudanabaena phage Pam5]|nr:hypothetical protein Pam5_68 [Pseudanabaena phage Pam5]